MDKEKLQCNKKALPRSRDEVRGRKESLDLVFEAAFLFGRPLEWLTA